MSLSRKIARHRLPGLMPTRIVLDDSGRSHVTPDKGKANGSCNRTACQRPLACEEVHQFMDGNFTGGPRLHYCADCAWEFDKWDRQSGDPIRIKRETKVAPQPIEGGER